MNFPWKSQALTVITAPDSGRLHITVGVTYPSMHGCTPVNVTVTRLVKFDGGITVYSRRGGPLSGYRTYDDIKTFCEGIRHRIAYENNAVQSVDVTGYFRKHGLRSGNEGKLG